MLSGFHTGTLEHLQLGAGLFLKNFDPDRASCSEELRSMIIGAVESGENVLGATRGGGSFTCVPALRALEMDGVRTPVVGGTVNDGWQVRLSGTLLEMTPENFALALCGGQVEVNGNVTTVRAKMDVDEEDYLPRLCWVGDTARGLVLIELTGALNMTGAAFTFQDKGEGTLPFSFQAHALHPEDEDTAPFRVMFFAVGGVG